MKIAITGATGNLGTALLRRLLTDGGHELVGLVRRPPARPRRAPYAWDDVSWTSVDLAREDCRPALAAAFAGADAVVHLAWGSSLHDLRYLERLGVGGTRRVLEAAAAQQVPHLVHLSSVGAYSPR